MDEMTEQVASELLKELGLTYSQAAVCLGEGKWILYIWKKQRRPALVRWKGVPVEYNIGGGMPRAL